jgi:AcrR family transcriptional regulator
VSSSSAPGDPRRQVRERILEAFAERARVLGTRGVVMADLARELGMSTRTLYQHFPAKAELVRALMERWADEYLGERGRRILEDRPPLESMKEAAAEWVDAQARFSSRFWRDLARDHPEVWQSFQERLGRGLGRARERVLPLLRDGVPTDLVLRLLIQSVQFAADPERCERLGLSRREAVEAAIDLWARGALAPEARPPLSVVPGED